MGTAQVEVDEINGGGILTHGVVNLNVGAVDQPNIKVGPRTAIAVDQNDPTSYNAYRKYNQLHFVDLADATTISAIRIWLSSYIFRDGERIATNLVRPGVDGYYPATFEEPTRETYVKYPMATSEPVIYGRVHPNLGINGDLLGGLTSPGYTDLWVWQHQTLPHTPPGPLTNKQFTYAWDETYT